ncbi:MAG: class D beta-lactamase [Magnetococcales bacterium]|nr:class D beta-lactamase [Magnetococcales bacterium]
MKLISWIVIVLFLPIFLCQAETWQDPGLTTILQNTGLEGCIVLKEVHKDRIRVSDSSRCEQRYLPASTFKIANALIALETGVVKDNEIFPWDGTPLPIKSWEKDMDLQEAMAVSSVPVFQTIARRIGQHRMAEWVQKIGYGNSEIGTTVDRFWLEGPLAISPCEQVHFMARLAQDQLPFAKQTLAGLRRLLPHEDIGEAHLFGKTGWASVAKPKIGWYVGWVENHENIVTFAVNIPMESLVDAPLRKSLALAALRYAGAIDTQ